MSNKTDFTNDPFDEFEFKPLTSGLGFHKKETTNSTSPTTNTHSTVTPKVEFKNTHLNFDNTQTSQPTFNLQSPLPRNSEITAPRKTMNIPTIEDDSIAKAQTAVNEILKSLNHKKQQEESLAKQNKRISWAAATPSLSAGFLDGMLITAFFLLSLILMLAITKIDLIANITQPDPQYLIYWATLSLLGATQIIYYVCCRAFLGYTPGEWAFDQRCGNEIQQASMTYILKVTLRTVLNIITGFILMPIVSKILGYDILAVFSGVQIQRQKIS